MILRTMVLKTMVRSLVAMGVFLALLTAAHLLPDPCQDGDDDCCTAESAASGCETAGCNTSGCNTADCATPCCVGMVATTEAIFRLDLPLGHTPAFEVVVPRHDFTPRDPLIRPPISA
jgi:hypothetical protein